jgi:NAD-dependent dihydropyrimidine dehydrogenase PreA subunit
MIAALVEERCTNCNACVESCPARVFDRGARVPVLARVADCLTCYLCELACEQDALWVAPEVDSALAPPLPDLLASGLLGRVRQDSGWNLAFDAGQLDDYRLLGPLLNEGVEIATRRYAQRQRDLPE